ncbi:MmcQ/YjbR family DNA-binding protein [Actinokineospora bangkokensis]|uniref:Phosphoribosylglycinamide formyltransferase n=1 Tax=Actinokineospora bangkokensis TaxID=1193682 RepID=A0A1Q9LNJ9_9PSEU|nr:MmcQ/YjbR family DNA-binding protein [Actinokineospora bangkokensis]OLR93591.1 phosphoribosylglycinamide formyltransferase [Actinokineospora bangkokensis]
MTDPIPAIRSLCLPFPGCAERLSHGEPAWFAGARRRFVTYAGIRHCARPAIWCAAPPGAQEALVAADPVRFFRPPYVGHRGWLGVYLDVAVDPAELAEIITDAYRQVAPPTLLAQLDAAPAHPAATPRELPGTRRG